MKVQKLATRAIMNTARRCISRTGVAATFITTLTCMLSSGSKIAPDSEQTRSMLTSLWMIGEICGTSFGTLFGGMSYDAIGFENGLLVVAGIQVNDALQFFA